MKGPLTPCVSPSKAFWKPTTLEARLGSLFHPHYQHLNSKNGKCALEPLKVFIQKALKKINSKYILLFGFYYFSKSLRYIYKTRLSF